MNNYNSMFELTMKGLMYSLTVSLWIIIFGSNVFPQSLPEDSLQSYNVHFQQTIITQGHPSFPALYSGKNSLISESETETSLTSTLFLGLRLWGGASLYLNPEISGGSGISQAVGLAGFSNGETFRIGSPKPVAYAARLFLRYVVNLHGQRKEVEDQPNILKDRLSENQVILTVGKFAIADIFGNNTYSHDPRTQFLNWSLMSAGAWDYPADTRGYTWGLTAEYHRTEWSLRAAAVMVPESANGMELDAHIDKAYGLAIEAERDYNVNDNKGALRFLVYYNKGRMGSYSLAVNDPVYNTDIKATRQYGRYKYGFSLSLEQELTANVGMFLRLSWDDGKTETWAFTEIDRSTSLGVVFNGDLWKRKNDQSGLAAVINGLSNDHRNYLSHGGYGFIIGDGALNYALESIYEMYYRIGLFKNVYVTADYQFVLNPAYNADRGPVNIFALRVHTEF